MCSSDLRERASFWAEVGGARCRPRDSKVFKQMASPSDRVVHRVVALMIMMASGWYLGVGGTLG